MEILLKILVILLLIACIIILMLQYNALKHAALKELFNQPFPHNDFGAATIETVVQGDMKSVGGMSGLDNLDGTGSGPMGSGYMDISGSYPDLSGAYYGQRYTDLSGGRPDGSYAPGPPGGFSNLDGTRDGGGSGPDQSSYINGGGPIPNLTDRTLGVIPVNEPGGDEDYPNQAHGMHPYNVESPRGDHGEISKPYTYYYLEGDNINVPCKSDKDCGNTKCSESGFCRY